MKTKTLEDALFDTGAPDEIILLAMVEGCKQDMKYDNNTEDMLKYDYSITNEPFKFIVCFSGTQQGQDFWLSINQLYRLR